MKNLLVLRNVVVLMSLFAGAATLRAQGTAFTYQGRLVENGSQANGIYDLRFTIYDSTNSPGVVVAGPITNTATSVGGGLFTVTLDFGAGVLDGNARWLEIGVKSNGVAGAHIPLTPRQALKPSPYAIFAGGAQTASTVATGGVSAASLAVGAVASSAIGDGSIQTNDLSAPLLDGTFWRLNGNTGVGNFLGSTDFRPLELRVNNTPALRLVPTSSGANIIGGFSGNSVSTGVEGATISGGGAPDEPNRIEGGFSAIGGGWGNTNGGFNSFIGGGYWNLIQAGGSGFNSFIGAGAENVIGINAFFGVVAGGRGNVISNQSQYPTIGGGRLNRVAGTSSTIAGGERNTAANSFSTVGGGLRNSAAGGNSFVAGGTVAGGNDNFAGTNASFIGGGNRNTNTSLSAVIGGGQRNTISDVSDYSVIGGGLQNVIHDVAFASAIAGGRQNTIQTNAAFAVIGGGYNNVIDINADVSTIGGGEGNSISNAAPHAVIAGGIGNRSDAGASFIGGGSYNVNNGPGAFIGGGIANRAENFDAVIGGGAANVNAGYRSFIGGGEGNSIFNFGSHSTIGGGAYNAIHTNAFSSTVGGGVQNIISRDAFNSTIGGGYTNIIETNAVASTIAGGTFNVIGPSAHLATIGGGTFNNNSGQYATIGGGYANVARGNSATVGGGGLNSATGQNATVPGGAFNDALGDFSFASGRRAKASHPGTFVWADSTDADFTSTLNNQFSVRASGGVRLVTSGAGATLDGQPVLSGTVSSAQLADGSVTAAKIPAGQVVKSLNSLMDNVTLTAGTNVTITPSGNTLQIAATFTGPVSDSQLSSNIARLNAPAAFTGSVTATNVANSFNGAFAGNGGGLTNLSAANLSGFVPSAALTSVPAANLTGSVPAASLTSVPASSLTGTIADARLSANVALLNANQTFTGNNSFSSALGLGTANPAAKLHLYSTDNPTTMRIQSTGTPGFGRIEFVSNPQGDANEWRPGYIQSQDVGGFTGGLGFFVNGTGAGSKFGSTEVMSLTLDRVSVSGAVEGIRATTTNMFGGAVHGVNGSGGGYGLIGRATGFGSAIFGDNANPNGLAGYFLGNVRVDGNVEVSAPATLSFGAQTRQMLNLWGTGYGIGIQSGTLYSRVDSGGIGFNWYKGGVHNDGAGNAGGGATLMSLSTAGLTVNGVFVSTSDRNAKENFAPVDPKEVLAKVAALPISRWNFKQDARTPHVGPMAQDFHAAFGLGTDDKHIATVDADGVALAAIQGLNQKVEEKEARIRELEKAVGELKQLVGKLAENRPSERP